MEIIIPKNLHIMGSSGQADRIERKEMALFTTRMHSSRMRTVHCSGGRGRVCIPACTGQGGLAGGEGVSAQGVSARGCLPQCMLGHTHPCE